MASVWNSTRGRITRGFALCIVLLHCRDEADAEGFDRADGTTGGLPVEVLEREFVFEDGLDQRE